MSAWRIYKPHRVLWLLVFYTPQHSMFFNKKCRYTARWRVLLPSLPEFYQNLVDNMAWCALLLPWTSKTRVNTIDVRVCRSGNERLWEEFHVLVLLFFNFQKPTPKGHVRTRSSTNIPARFGIFLPHSWFYNTSKIREVPEIVEMGSAWRVGGV